MADRAVDALAEIWAPLENAKCLEVRGLVLVAMGDLQGREAQAQAKLTYLELGCSNPLVLEGWPADVSGNKKRDE